jgi:hypothetical protein
LLAGIHPINCCRILAAASQATSTMYEVVGCTVPKISDLISLLIAWFSQFIKKVYIIFSRLQEKLEEKYLFLKEKVLSV